MAYRRTMAAVVRFSCPDVPARSCRTNCRQARQQSLQPAIRARWMAQRGNDPFRRVTAGFRDPAQGHFIGGEVDAKTSAVAMQRCCTAAGNRSSLRPAAEDAAAKLE